MFMYYVQSNGRPALQCRSATGGFHNNSSGLLALSRVLGSEDMAVVFDKRDTRRGVNHTAPVYRCGLRRETERPFMLEEPEQLWASVRRRFDGELRGRGVRGAGRLCASKNYGAENAEELAGLAFGLSQRPRRAGSKARENVDVVARGQAAVQDGRLLLCFGKASRTWPGHENTLMIANHSDRTEKEAQRQDRS